MRRRALPNLADLKVENVTKMLARMATDGVVEKCGRGKYANPKIRPAA